MSRWQGQAISSYIEIHFIDKSHEAPGSALPSGQARRAPTGPAYWAIAYGPSLLVHLINHVLVHVGQTGSCKLGDDLAFFGDILI